jgi:hypothetical protein
MLLFKSADDLSKVDSHNPAYPLIKELVEVLINAYTWEGHPYNHEDYGYLILIEEDDVDQVLEPVQCKLVDVLWEGASLRGDFFYAVYLANNEYGLGFVIPNADWVKGELRTLLEEMIEQ